MPIPTPRRRSTQSKNRNKDRLYVALYFQSRDSEYHWSLLRAPKAACPSDTTSTTRYHVTKKLRMQGDDLALKWEFEQMPLSKVQNSRLMAKVLIGKVDASWGVFEESLTKVRIMHCIPEWNCMDWTRDAIAQLSKDSVLSQSSITDWPYIESKCIKYVQVKEQQGRYDASLEHVPTYDLLGGFELVS